MLGFVAQPSQPGDPRLRGEIQFRRVLKAQHHRLTGHPRHRPRGMDFRIRATHRRVVQQPVGGLVPPSPRRPAGMVPVGRADRSSTNLINRWSAAASPNSKS